ncbi:MAG: hypothetical protein HXY40_02055 [Chloroflexi bacterium]|nr:hypothetical protein [Chloroflexota bacterium]
MSANIDAMVREAIRMYRAGSKNEARTLLLKAVELDQYNEQAWMWLSATVDSVEEQRTCLENVLVINPNNERAKKGLEMLAAKSSEAPKPPSTPKAPFGAPAADELPTSLEWDMPSTETSSSSTYRRVNEPTKQEYDDWVSSLNLGGAGAPPANTPAPAAPVSSFTMTPFTEDADLFGIDDQPAGPPSKAPPKPVPAASSFPASPPPPTRSPAPKVMSPGAEDGDDLLDDIENVIERDEFDDFEGFGNGEDDQDPSEYFRMIPAHIKATRLPGENEKYPAYLTIGIGVLVVLNLLAAGLLLYNLLPGLG